MNNSGRKSFIDMLKATFRPRLTGSSRRRRYREKGRTKFEIHQAHNFLRSILQHSHDMIFVTDVHGIIVSFNKGGEEALGYTRKELAGRHLRDFVQHPHELQKLLEDSRINSSTVSMDFPFLHKEGHSVYFNLSLIDLKNANGQSIGTIGVCRNITRWKSLQEDLIRVDRLAEMGRIAAAVAHEINNPLAVIGEAAGWGAAVARDADAIKQEDREELEKIFKDISKQTKRCRNRTQQILGFARDSEPAKREFDIHELLKGTVIFLQPEIKFKNIEIVYQFAEGPIILKSDPKMLEQVFVNLLTNAIYAIKEKGEAEGTIKLITNISEGKAEIKVSDSGTGMSDEVRKKIFDLFYTTKPRGKGTGLGLPISHNIVKKLGGEMICESRMGQGTTFTIWIPLS